MLNRTGFFPGIKSVYIVLLAFWCTTSACFKTAFRCLPLIHSPVWPDIACKSILLINYALFSHILMQRHGVVAVFNPAALENYLEDSTFLGM